MLYWRWHYHGEFVGEEKGDLVASLGTIAVGVEEHKQRLHDQPDGVHIAALLDAIRVVILVLAASGFPKAVAPECGNKFSQRPARN
jgi:hypothetical protein